MKTAIIHYWLVGMRGGEKVLERLCRLFPQADIYTHVYVPDKISPVIKAHTVQTTFINALPFATKNYQRYLPLMPLALEQLDLRKYDLVISSESGPAKGVLTKAETTHICYCHSPMRYLWDMYQDYLETSGFLTRTGMRIFSHRLRQWDALSALRVDHFAANSKTVAARIRKHYRRDATVIYPPVDVSFFKPVDNIFKRAGYEAPYLCFGEMVAYKRMDLAVKACTESKRPLIVVGDGPERKRLQSLAGPTVTFVGRVDSGRLLHIVNNCRALLFPGEEDFGIIPLEMQAAGKPVIAFGKGGALETIIPERTGLFFSEQTAESLIASLEIFEQQESSFDPAIISAHAQTFAPEQFDEAFMALVKSCR